MASQELLTASEDSTASGITRENGEYLQNRERRDRFDSEKDMLERRQVEAKESLPYHYSGQDIINYLQKRIDGMYARDQKEASQMNLRLKELESRWMDASSKYLALATTSPEKVKEKEELWEKLTIARTALEDFEKELSGPKLRTEPISHNN